MKQDPESLFQEAKKAFLSAESGKSLYSAKVLHIGKKGRLSLALKEVKNLPPEKRREW